jgi:DNA-binding transcriptional MerR regulator
VSRLSAEGVNLAGIQRILALESENERLRSQLGVLLAEVQRLRPGIGSRSGGTPSEPSTALVVWRPRPADRAPRDRSG